MGLTTAAFENEARQLDRMADIIDHLNRAAASPILAAEAKAYRTVADRLRAKANRAVGDDLVGAAEIAELLQVSTTRVRQLLNGQDWPVPAADLAAGRVYLAVDIDDFRAGWKRKPGRPRRKDAPQE